MFTQFFYFLKRNIKLLCFSLIWLLGLSLGAYVASQTTTIHNSWMQSLYYSRLSIIGFLAMLIFPFLLSAILFRMSFWKMVLLLFFVKAFAFSWLASSIILYFDGAGWLLRWLLLFSESIASVLLVWFWTRNRQGRSNRRQNDLLLCLVIALVIGCIDSSVVSPFGIAMLTHF